jgi:flagellar motor protein MotB
MSYRRRRKEDKTDNSAGNVAQLITLSLFIMLLAFFIVLNSISTYEDEKKSAAIKSVDEAFSKHALDLDESPSLNPAIEKSVHEGHVFDRLDALFDSQISTYEIKANKATGVMSVDIPLEEFARTMSIIGQKDLTKIPSKRVIVKGKYFLPTLVSVLRSEQEGVSTRMEIIMHVDKNPVYLEGKTSEKLEVAMNSVAGFSERLEEIGFPQKLLNIGLKKGDSKSLTLTFRRHNEFSFTKGNIQKGISGVGE